MRQFMVQVVEASLNVLTLRVCSGLKIGKRGFVSWAASIRHPSPNVKTFCNFEPQIWLEIITSRDNF